MRGALAGACLSQMYVPCAMGDPRCRHLLRIIEAISRADQSIDWCTIIATDAPNSMGCLDSHGAPYGSRTRLFRLKSLTEIWRYKAHSENSCSVLVMERQSPSRPFGMALLRRATGHVPDLASAKGASTPRSITLDNKGVIGRNRSAGLQ